MTIGDTINLICIASSFIGAYYAARGLLSLDPTEILKSYSSYTGIIHSLEDMTTIVRLRLDIRMGILYVVLSAILQVLTLPKNELKDYELSYTCFFFVIVLVVTIFYWMHISSQKILIEKVTQVNKLYLKKIIDKIPNRINGLSMFNYDLIFNCAKNYFGMQKKEDQEIKEFLDEISDFVGAKKI